MVPLVVDPAVPDAEDEDPEADSLPPDVQAGSIATRRIRPARDSMTGIIAPVPPEYKRSTTRRM
ncbi:MAG: hypothetical protein D6705_17265 [Deltaproteobacteria bacterium]|nr:MAG: hypothetical protein D6705_17265 [Deltaproteobacteria bacterium]